MLTMDVEELQAQMSQAIDRVRKGEVIGITSDGEMVARLVPARRAPSQEEIQAALASLDALAEEIGKHVTEPTDVAALISEMRR